MGTDGRAEAGSEVRRETIAFGTGASSGMGERGLVVGVAKVRSSPSADASTATDSFEVDTVDKMAKGCGRGFLTSEGCIRRLALSKAVMEDIRNGVNYIPSKRRTFGCIRDIPQARGQLGSDFQSRL